MKNYNQAPLPFMGQKRRFLKQFREKLALCPGDATYVDLFGGSGLLSHTVKRHYPSARVIYNDYDNYTARIAAIARTNTLLADIRNIATGLPKDKLIREPYRSTILARIKAEPGFVDYITLSSSLLFSMQYATDYESLAKTSMYNVIKKSDYNADGYLDGLERVREDYKALFERTRSERGVVYLVDPPYLNTEVGTYQNYWRLKDYLDVLDVLKANNYFYFTSDKSSIIELCEWVATKTGSVNPFAGADVKTVYSPMNYNSSYTDIMLYKSLTNGQGESAEQGC